MEICDNLRSELAMFTNIYVNVDECWLTSSIPQQMFNLQIVLKYVVIPNNVDSEVLNVVEVN